MIGCGGGCGAFVVLSILLTVVGGYMMMRPFGRAIDEQERLEERYGARADYVPPVDGVTPDRIKRFLAVRAGLLEFCDEFEAMGEDFQRMDDLDSSGDEPSAGEALKAVGNIMGTVLQVPALIGKLTATRNELLMENEMSPGEYAWIYVLAYHSWLGFEPNTSFDNEHEGSFTSNELGLIRVLMENHAEALEAAGRADEARRWRDEAGRLNRTEGGVPFAMGDLPGEIEVILRPYRGKLEASFCPAMAGLDLTRVQKKGMSIHAE